jgi:N-acetylglucosaminyl-diphospho-decaprenol L-rhamnosyltransferase
VTTAIVVTYNSATWIDRCLESLRGTPTIVIDNASSDSTVEIVQRNHPEVRLVARARNGGFAVAVNQAAALVPGEDILLMNPDAAARPGSIATLESYLGEHPQVGIVVPRLVNPDGSVQPNARTFPTPWTMLARRTIFGWTPIGRRIHRDHLLAGRVPEVARPVQSAIGAVMLVRRAAISEVGPMDERIFLYGEDWDWCYRMWAAGWEVHMEPAAIMEHEYERKSRRTFDLRSPAVRHHWASALKLVAIHPGLVVGRMPAGAREAAGWAEDLRGT